MCRIFARGTFILLAGIPKCGFRQSQHLRKKTYSRIFLIESSRFSRENVNLLNPLIRRIKFL